MGIIAPVVAIAWTVLIFNTNEPTWLQWISSIVMAMFAVCFLFNMIDSRRKDKKEKLDTNYKESQGKSIHEIMNEKHDELFKNRDPEEINNTKE